MINELGIFLRKIRKETGDTLRVMSSKLGISVTFLSALEIGKKTIPLEYNNKISSVYSLNEEQKNELEDAINKSNSKISIGLNELNEDQTELSLLFARKIKNADPNLISKLRDALNENKN